MLKAEVVSSLSQVLSKMNQFSCNFQFQRCEECLNEVIKRMNEFMKEFIRRNAQNNRF